MSGGTMTWAPRNLRGLGCERIPSGRVMSKRVDKLQRAVISWEECLARLAECIVQFQRIEDGLNLCISSMIGRSRKVGAIVTSEMSFRAKVSVYGALALHTLRRDSLPVDIAELIQRLHWAEQQRNTLVHSLWNASESKPDTIRREKSAIRKNVLTVAREHHTPEELEDLSRRFEGIVEDLFYLQPRCPRKNANCET